MNRHLFIRLVIDLSMTVLMLVAMAYHITGNAVHEWVGVPLFVLFIGHNVLNRKWYKAMFERRHNARRILSIIVNFLFLVSMATVLISSVPISRDLFPFIVIENDMMARQVHVLASYWGFIFMAVHIGISWGTIMNAARKMAGLTSKNRIRTITLRIIAVLIVVYGVETSFEREIGSKLTIYNPFGWYSDESNISFLVDYLSIMGIYICGAHYAIQFVRKQEKAKQPSKA